MKTLFLAAILFSLIVIALKSPDQTFQEAALDLGSKGLDAVYSPVGPNIDPWKAEKQYPGEPLQVKQDKLNSVEEAFLQDAAVTEREGETGLDDHPEETAALGKPKAQPYAVPGPSLSAAPLTPVEKTELPEFLPEMPYGSGKESSSGDSLAELVPLYEDASRLLAEIK